MNLRKDNESTALAFGSAIHKALEHWYQLPIEKRELHKDHLEQAEAETFRPRPEGWFSVDNTALGSIAQFCTAGRPVLGSLDPIDKHSLQNGLKILKAYFKHYANDGLEVYRDKDGPCIERQFSFIIHDGPLLQIEYFGTIDVILKNKNTGMLMVADHKTTASLGSEFYNRCKPNPQYTGYVLGAREGLGIETNLFMINGIQTAKTKTEFARQITDRTEDDFKELRDSVYHRVWEWLTAIDNNIFPQTAPNPCSMYGGCSYRGICEVPHKIRQNVIDANYSIKK